MSKHANPTLVGGFILGAIGLAVTGVLVFGAGSLLRHKLRAVAYFEGSVQGLSIGAPVNFRGVRVGKVSALRIDLDVGAAEPQIPVYMEFDPESIHRVGGDKSGSALLTEAIERGLRAQLAPQSLVTGQLLVELDAEPGTPARFVGVDKSIPEIPTIKSDVEHVKDMLVRLPLQELVVSALRTLNDLDKILTSPTVPALMSSLASAAENGDKLLAELRVNQGTLMARVTDVLTAVNDGLPELLKVLAGAEALLKTTDEALVPSLRSTLRATEATMRQAERTLADADGLLAANSPQRADLNESLRNIAAASRSMRSLADQLDRKPNAIVMGR